MHQAALDRLQDLKEQYSALLSQEDALRFEGWEGRTAILSLLINGIYATLLRESEAAEVAERSRY